MGRRAKGEGGLTYRSDGRWEGSLVVGYTPAGKKIRKSVYGRTKEEAFAKLDEARDALKQQAAPGEAQNSPRTSVKALGDIWLTSLLHSVSERTGDRYRVDLTYCLPFVGKVPAADLGPHHVVQMYRQAAEAGLSPYQQHKGGKALRRLLAYGVRFRYCLENVAAQVPLPRYVKKDIHPLSRQQVHSLFQSSHGDRLLALYVLAVDSGARQGELFALEWSDWHPESHELSITKAISERNGRLTCKEPKTRASRRRVVVSAQTATALAMHRIRMRAEGHDSQVMFPDEKGGWLRCSNFHRDHWQPALRRAGLPHIRFHDLRHTCATLLLQAGDNLKSIADRLGHANVDMVLRTYGHVVPSMRRESARLMEDMLG